MMTYQEREATRGTMKPTHELTVSQLCEIADRAAAQASEYYMLADKVARGVHVEDDGYRRVVKKYFGDA